MERKKWTKNTSFLFLLISLSFSESVQYAYTMYIYKAILLLVRGKNLSYFMEAFHGVMQVFPSYVFFQAEQGWSLHEAAVDFKLMQFLCSLKIHCSCFCKDETLLSDFGKLCNSCWSQKHVQLLNNGCHLMQNW